MVSELESNELVVVSFSVIDEVVASEVESNAWELAEVDKSDDMFEVDSVEKVSEEVSAVLEIISMDVVESMVLNCTVVNVGSLELVT